MSDDVKTTSSEVKTQKIVVSEAKDASVLDKTADTKDADVKATDIKAKATEDKAKAIADATTKPSTTVSAKTSEDKLIEKLKLNLDKYIDPGLNIANRANAWKVVVDIVNINAKMEVMSVIYEFFKTHKSNYMLNEMVALQGTHMFSKEIKMRTDVLYTTMRAIVNNYRAKINIDIVRDIFKNDDLANWLAIVQSGLYTK